MPAVLDGSLRETRVVGLARAGLTGSRTGRADDLGATTTLARPRHWAARWGPRRGGRRAGAAQHGDVGGNVVIGGDVACALLALDATVDLGSRTVPPALWGGLGMDIVRSVSFNDEAAADSVFIRWARRAANSPAVVCVAVAGGRVAIGGVGPHPVRSAGAEAHLDDPGAAGKAAAAEVDPPTDGIASGWYRKRMTEVFVRRALEAWHAV